MRSSITALACALLLTMSLPAAAAKSTSAEPAPAAARQDSLEAWHQQILARYKKVRYLNAERKPMEPEAFMAVLAKHERGFDMTTPRPDRGELITLQLRALEQQR